MSLFQGIGNAFMTLRNTFRFVDIIDIALMAALIYGLILLVRQTRAISLIKGILLLVIAYIFAELFDLKTIKFVFENVLQVGLIAVVVVFQPELRRVLERIGRGKFNGVLGFLNPKVNAEKQIVWQSTIATICDSCEHMSASKTGALIVIERTTGLGEIINTGTVIDAEASSELIETVFYEGSPLHDGAMVIRDGRVHAAGCLLPLTTNSDISRDMGTRHRAAIGMSENSDALVVIVSEETGIISAAKNGIVVRRLDRASLFKVLENEIIPPQPEDNKKSAPVKEDLDEE